MSWEMCSADRTAQLPPVPESQGPQGIVESSNSKPCACVGTKSPRPKPPASPRRREHRSPFRTWGPSLFRSHQDGAVGRASPRGKPRDGGSNMGRAGKAAAWIAKSPGMMATRRQTAGLATSPTRATDGRLACKKGTRQHTNWNGLSSDGLGRPPQTTTTPTTANCC